MKQFVPLLALLLSIAVPANVIAQPRVIGDLTQGALLGEIRDTAQLQNDFSDQHELLAQASTRLGLTQADFNDVQSSVAHGRARYVEIPRHLDGMAGQHNGVAFAVHDIIIPPHVYGWEVDLERDTTIVRVFMPNRCGNMSYLIVPRRPVVAVAAPYHATLPAPAPTLAPEETPAPAAVVMAPAAPAVAAPAAHHFALLPWLALGLIGIAFAHGGSSSTGVSTISPVRPTIVPTPIPVHTICPAAIHK